MFDKKVVDKSVTKKVLEIIENIDAPYAELISDASQQELLNRIEFLKRAATLIFVLNFAKVEDENGFIDKYNIEGVVAKLMKNINPDIYSEFLFLRERGIV